MKVPLLDVTAEHGVVRKGDVIANVAIMRDMGTNHKDATFADPCNPAAGFGADIHGNAFAYLAACADNESGRLAAIVDRLWRRAERRKRPGRVTHVRPGAQHRLWQCRGGHHNGWTCQGRFLPQRVEWPDFMIAGFQLTSIRPETT